jgi:hypothetical protein
MKSPVLALTCLMVAAAFATPRAQEPAPDKSLDRMRSVLAKPPLRLTFPESEATFKIHIQAIHPMHEIFDVVPWATEPVGWQPPGIGFDLLSVFQYVVKSAADAKREHDVHAARDEVQRAIADYCAAQPNPNAIVMCTNLPAAR